MKVDLIGLLICGWAGCCAPSSFMNFIHSAYGPGANGRQFSFLSPFSSFSKSWMREEKELNGRRDNTDQPLLNFHHSKLKVFHFFKFSPRMICIIHTVIILFFISRSKINFTSRNQEKKWIFLFLWLMEWMKWFWFVASSIKENKFSFNYGVKGYMFSAQQTPPFHQPSINH